jgi:glycine cleavage system H protein
MNIPGSLRYTITHEWVRRESDGTISIGITDHAQEELGDLVFIELPAVGCKVSSGEACAVVESVKAASDIYAPLDGEITEANQPVVDAPESVNKDAYANWLFRMRPATPADVDKLLDARAYAKTIGIEKS